MKTLPVGDELFCKLGETAQENWDLVDGAKKHHWFFHLTDFPSPYVVLECDRQEPNAHIKERCAELCVANSKQKSAKKVKVDATICGNVRVDKRDAVGECDYKNESKVEIIVIKGGKKQSDAEDLDGSVVENDGHGKATSSTGTSRGKGGYYSDSKAGSPADSGVAEGKHITIEKAPGAKGFARISCKDEAVRKAILREFEEIAVKSGVVVKLQPQIDPQTKDEVPTDIFASWGRKVEERTPVSESELLKCFDAIASRAAAAAQRAAPAKAAGNFVEVRKAAVGGCAVVSCKDGELRARVLAQGQEVTIGDITVKLNPQRDPKTKDDVPTDIFAAWGRKVEEKTPISEAVLLDFFDDLCSRLDNLPAEDFANALSSGDAT